MLLVCAFGVVVQSIAVDLRNLANCDPPAESIIQSVLAELFVGAPSAARDVYQRSKVLDLLSAVPVSDEAPTIEPPLLRTVLPAYGTSGFCYVAAWVGGRGSFHATP
jgi:hypothetical protein